MKNWYALNLFPFCKVEM